MSEVSSSPAEFDPMHIEPDRMRAFLAQLSTDDAYHPGEFVMIVQEADGTLTVVDHADSEVDLMTGQQPGFAGHIGRVPSVLKPGEVTLIMGEHGESHTFQDPWAGGIRHWQEESIRKIGEVVEIDHGDGVTLVIDPSIHGADGGPQEAPPDEHYFNN